MVESRQGATVLPRQSHDERVWGDATADPRSESANTHYVPRSVSEPEQEN